MNPKVKSFYHQDTYTWTHVISCPQTRNAAIIDPVLDYNPNNANTATTSIDEVLAYIRANKMQLNYVLETHAHADHLSSAHYVADQTHAKIVIGEKITSVQETFKKIFNLAESFKTDGSQFQRLLKGNDVIKLGKCQIQAIQTPGHTNDSMSFICGESVFIGDTLFSPDYGTARCDFPGGDAEKFFDSIQKIYRLGDDKKLYLCHDYPPNNREPKAWFLSKDQQQNNIHLNANTIKSEFVAMRNKRDASLNQPRLIIPSIQVNINAGNFPRPESNGKIYLKIPLNTLGKT